MCENVSNNNPISAYNSAINEKSRKTLNASNDYIIGILCNYENDIRINDEEDEIKKNIIHKVDKSSNSSTRRTNKAIASKKKING